MIRIEVGDLAFQPVNAVIRPVTTLLEPTSSTLKNLERLAGPVLAALSNAQELDIGAATVTAAGDIDAEFIIHAVIRSASEPVTPAGVRRALQSVMERAADWEFASLALPLIGAGPGNLSPEAAADLMAEVIVKQFKERAHPTDVYIVASSENERETLQARFDRGLQ